MSSSDSDSDPSLPHFETVVTIAAVEPDRSRTSSVNLKKCNKTSSNSKSRRILPDLDVIEVLSDHNNQVNSISRDSSKVSYKSFKNQLIMNQENTTEELLHPTSSQVKPAVRKHQQKKKNAFKRDPKPVKRIRYNIKRFDKSTSDDDDDDDIYNKILKNNQRAIKRREPITNINQTLNKSKARENSSVKVPEVKSKRPFVVEDIIGYANIKKFNESTSDDDDDDERENSSVKVPEVKSKRPFVVEDIIGYAKNPKRDEEFTSLWNNWAIKENVKKHAEKKTLENSLELDSNLKVINESKNTAEEILRNTTEELLQLTSSQVKPAVRKHPQKKKNAFKRDPKPVKRFQYNIKKLNESGPDDDDDDDIYNKILKNNQRAIKRREPITNKNQTLNKSKARENSSVKVPEVKSKRPFVVEDIIGYVKWNLGIIALGAEMSTKLKQTFVPENVKERAEKKTFKQDDDFLSLSSLENPLELDSNLKVVNESKTLNDKIYGTLKPDVEDGVKPRSDCNQKTDEEIHSVQNVVDLNESTVDEFTEASCTKFMAVSQDESSSPGEKRELLTENKLEEGGKDIFGWIATGIQEYQQDELFKQLEWHLKDISKFIQLKLDEINGPIAVKNCKFYNFLLDLEDKLNSIFNGNSDIDEQDFM